MLHADHRGWQTIGKRYSWQPGAAFQVAGRVPRPHEKAVPDSQAGRERPCHQAQTYPNMAVQAIGQPH